jgi:hypothetical protein
MKVSQLRKRKPSEVASLRSMRAWHKVRDVLRRETRKRWQNCALEDIDIDRICLDVIASHAQLVAHALSTFVLEELAAQFQKEGLPYYIEPIFRQVFAFEQEQRRKVWLENMPLPKPDRLI